VAAAATRDTLGRLLDLTAAGMFPHTVSKDDCRFCDFGAICGGAEEASARSQEKLSAATEAALVRFRELGEE
jgi:hypothetical protein